MTHFDQTYSQTEGTHPPKKFSFGQLVQFKRHSKGNESNEKIQAGASPLPYFGNARDKTILGSIMMQIVVVLHGSNNNHTKRNINQDSYQN